MDLQYSSLRKSSYHRYVFPVQILRSGRDPFTISCFTWPLLRCILHVTRAQHTVFDSNMPIWKTEGKIQDHFTACHSLPLGRCTRPLYMSCHVCQKDVHVRCCNHTDPLKHVHSHDPRGMLGGKEGLATRHACGQSRGDEYIVLRVTRLTNRSLFLAISS